MYLIKECTKNEIKLLNQAGIWIEDKDYTADELKKYEMQIADYIF